MAGATARQPPPPVPHPRRSQPPELRPSGYDAGDDRLAILRAYSQNIVDFITFLSIAHSADDLMARGESGIAVIDNTIWAEPRRDVSAALRNAPRRSRLHSGPDRPIPRSGSLA